MTGTLDHLLANPILLIPILLVVTMIVFAIFKKLMKVAAMLAIAGALYVLLTRSMGGGP